MVDEATPPLTVEQMADQIDKAQLEANSERLLSREYRASALHQARRALLQSRLEVSRLEAALREIASQCHNIPRGATAHRIEEIARAALSASTERVSDADSLGAPSGSLEGGRVHPPVE